MKKILFTLLLFSGALKAQKITFDAILEIANTNNYGIRNTELERELAQITRKIASVNVFNPRVPVSFQTLDNVALQKNFVPGPLFGQPEGTFKELVMGQKYVATFSVQPQFDILNLGNRAQKKMASLQELDVNNANLQQKRELYQQLNSVFYNIISFQNQEKVLTENRDVAKQILQITENRQREGIARIQEVNEAKVNLLTLEDKIFQVQQNKILQEDLLRVLLNTDIQLDLEDDNSIPLENEEPRSNLDLSRAFSQRQFAAQDYLTAKRDQLPVLSFISSFNWQNLSSSFFYGSGSNAIHFAYIGLKLSWDFPTNIQKISAVRSKEIQFKIAENQLLEAELKQNQTNNQLRVEFEKAKTQLKNFTAISSLRQDTFLKNKLQFEEGILPLDKLLISQNDFLVSQLNWVTSQMNVKYAFQNIRINNLF